MKGQSQEEQEPLGQLQFSVGSFKSPYADERFIPLIPASKRDWGLSFKQNKGLTLATSLALRSGLKVPWV
jgi:hypothetical protein